MRLVYLYVESEYTWRWFFFSGCMHTGGLEKWLVLDNLSVYTPSLEEEEKKEKNKGIKLTAGFFGASTG